MNAVRWNNSSGRHTARHLQRDKERQTLCGKTIKAEGREVIAYEELTESEWRDTCHVCRQMAKTFGKT